MLSKFPVIRAGQVVALCGVLVILSACAANNDQGGDTPDSSAGVSSLPAEAAKRLDASLLPISTFPGPDDAFTPAEGKKVTVITCSATGETCVRVATGAEEAGKILGWEVTVVDGKGDPATWNSAMSAAIASKTNGIILGGVPPFLVGAGLQAARDAGIPVIYTLGQEAGGADALVAPDRAESGRVLADYVARDSGGSGQVMILRDPEFPELEVMADAFKAELQVACPGCSVKAEQDFTLGAMVQTVPTLVQTAMQSNPGIGYVLGPFDATSTFMNQGVRAAAHDAVKVMGTGGDGSTIKSLESGDISASMGVPAEWIGFQSVDAIGRFLNKQAIPAVPVMQSLVVKDNMSTVAPHGAYDGGFDYVSAYRKVWGK